MQCRRDLLQGTDRKGSLQELLCQRCARPWKLSVVFFSKVWARRPVAFGCTFHVQVSLIRDHKCGVFISAP